MEKDMNLEFIREKIYEIKSAVMYSMCNELIRIPNSIVSVLKIDDEGQLWFLCTPPTYMVEECASTFPARLHFYRKGKFFHVEVSGKATIMNRAFDGLSKEEAAKKPILIKMTMQNVEYTAVNEKRPRNKFETIMENGYKWLLRNFALPRHEKSVLSKLHQTN